MAESENIDNKHQEYNLLSHTQTSVNSCLIQSSNDEPSNDLKNDENIITNRPEKNEIQNVKEKETSYEETKQHLSEKDKQYNLQDKERLNNQLKNEGVLRPKTLFDGSDFDVLKKEKEILKEDQEEDSNKPINENNGNTSFENDLAKFMICKKIYIDQYYKISDLFVKCPLYYNYRISLEYDKEGEAYYLFNSIDLSSSCSHNICSNQSQSIKIDIGSYDSRKEKRKKFIILQKPFRCACSCFCACCSRPTLNIFINNKEKEMIGFIREIRTKYNPIMYIFYKNGILKYKIATSYCQCGYCCRNCHCFEMCDKAKFDIFNYNDFNEKSIGSIEKVIVRGNKVKPDYEQITVNLPSNASNLDKVLIMASAFFIDLLYYQNIKNSKRCSGGPPSGY
jgi:hypothetical protein